VENKVCDYQCQASIHPAMQDYIRGHQYLEQPYINNNDKKFIRIYALISNNEPHKNSNYLSLRKAFN